MAFGEERGRLGGRDHRLAGVATDECVGDQRGLQVEEPARGAQPGAAEQLRVGSEGVVDRAVGDAGGGRDRAGGDRGGAGANGQ